MKRDMDLIRELLLRFEAATTPYLSVTDLVSHDIPNAASIEFHVTLMQQDDLLFDWGRGLAPSNKGYDLLDMIRDDKIWAKTKSAAVDVGGFTGDVLIALAKGFIKQKLEQHTGLEVDL